MSIEELFAAVKKNDVESVDFLLKGGVDVDAVNGNGRTALICAARDGHEKVVRLLLERGAEIDAVNRVRGGGFTALMYAARSGNEKVVRLLLERGAKIGAVDGGGWTALMCAAVSGHEEIVRLLLERGAKIDAVDGGGWTALMYAAVSGHEKVVRLLLEREAEIDAVNGDGWTALMCAARNGHEEVVRLLLERGVEIDAVNRNGYTALMWAVKNGHAKIVEMLIANGADTRIYIRDDRGDRRKTALDLAETEGIKEMIEKAAILEWLGARIRVFGGDQGGVQFVAKYEDFFKREVACLASLRSQLFLHVIGDRDILKICHEGKGFFATLKRNFRALRNLDENLIIMLKGAYREALRFAKFGEMGEFLRRWAVISERENGEVIEKCANHPHSSYSGDFAESIGNLEMLRAVKRRIVRILKSDHLSVDDAIFALYFINYDYVNVVKNLESDLGEVDDFAKAFVKEMEEGDAKREWGLLGVLENTHVMRLKREYVDGVTR